MLAVVWYVKEPDEQNVRFGFAGNVVPLPQENVEFEPLLPVGKSFVDFLDPPLVQCRYKILDGGVVVRNQPAATTGQACTINRR